MNNVIPNEVAILLNEKLKLYQTLSFIKDDPISVPHCFEKLQDIEISGFLTALISWGNRKSIIQSAHQLMRIMNYQPYDFILNYSRTDDKFLKKFYYRTFQPSDTLFFVRALSRYYQQYKSLEEVFFQKPIVEGIQHLREVLLQTPHQKRSAKHLPDVRKGSAAKRINMFLRWMVRKDCIDFGLWKNISTSELLIPLDIHTARTSYYLGLLKNTNSNLKNVLQLTEILKTLDNQDPVKYDFALFGMSRYEKIKEMKLKI